MASPVSGLGSNNGTQNSQSTANASALSNASNQQMFLQLLVSQLKNQDPTNPVDGTQFVSELSQFSQVEQLIAIRTDLEGALANNANAANTNNSTSGGNNQQSSNPTGTNPSNNTKN